MASGANGYGRGRFNPRRGCVGKIRYTQRPYAQEAMERRIALGAAPESLNVYPCPACKGWHVGTPTMRRLR